MKSTPPGFRPLLSLAFAFTTLIQAAAGDATGTWKWTFEIPNGQTINSEARLKQDGSKLTGVYVGRNATETAIEDGKVEDDKVSFKITRERDGQKFVLDYAGKLSGDTIDGKTSFQRDGSSREWDWKATREGGKAAASADGPATGTWTWSFTRGDGQTMAATVKLKQSGEKLAGAYIDARGREVALEEGTVKGDQITLKVSREREGQKVTTTFKGKLSGDTIKGKMEFQRDGEPRERDWEAKREGAGKAQAKAAGLWKWAFTRSNGETFDLQVRLKQDNDKLDGAFIWVDGSELPISNGTLKGEELAFNVVTDSDGRTVTSKFKGKVDGDWIRGKVDSDFSGESKTYDWEPKRVN